MQSGWLKLGEVKPTHGSGCGKVDMKTMWIRRVAIYERRWKRDYVVDKS